MNVSELKTSIDDWLRGTSSQVELPSEREWDSLDQLEIITHLHDALGPKVNQIEALNSFENFDRLVEILRQEGLLE